ncbi:MAG: pilus assembly protein PilM [Archangiaceae bacterium]|nr:pilus assembly protein PilM [Archangiaceae bacterium]
MARILGLDLGAYSVKGVLLETAMRSSTLRHFAEVRHTGDLKAAVTELLGKSFGLIDQVVVSVPGLSMATHPIALPFSDPKRIESTLAFEVEEQLPFDLSEAAYDYQVASVDAAGSQLLVGVVKKDELTRLLETLRELKVEPRIVTHPALVLQNLLPLTAPTENAVAVVDLGHERTCVAVGRQSVGVELARTFAGGGLALTKALATEFKIPIPEAQTWKDDHAALGEHVVGPDAERAANAFIRGMQSILRELKSTLKSYSARSKHTIDAVYLCGGTAKLPGLAEQLSADLGVPVKLLELPNDAKAALPGPTPQVCQAYALAQRGGASGAKAPRFNLRRNEFAFKSDLDFISDKLGQLATFASVLLVLLIASGIVRNTVLERREKAVDAMLCDITNRYLGRCEKNFDIALNMLQGKESPAAAIPKRSAVSLLADLTRVLPTEFPVSADQIVIDLDRISARMETDSSKHVEDIVAAIKNEKCFREVKEGKVEKSKDGSKVQFRLDIQIDCPAETSS